MQSTATRGSCTHRSSRVLAAAHAHGERACHQQRMSSRREDDACERRRADYVCGENGGYHHEVSVWFGLSCSCEMCRPGARTSGRVACTVFVRVGARVFQVYKRPKSSAAVRVRVTRVNIVKSSIMKITKYKNLKRVAACAAVPRPVAVMVVLLGWCACGPWPGAWACRMRWVHVGHLRFPTLAERDHPSSVSPPVS